MLRLLPPEHMETNMVTSCSQVGLPVEGGDYQPTYKTFNPKFALPTRCAGIKMEQRLRGLHLDSQATAGHCVTGHSLNIGDPKSTSTFTVTHSLQQGHIYSNKATPYNSAIPYGQASKHINLWGPSIPIKLAQFPFLSTYISWCLFLSW